MGESYTSITKYRKKQSIYESDHFTIPRNSVSVLTESTIALPKTPERDQLISTGAETGVSAGSSEEHVHNVNNDNIAKNQLFHQFLLFNTLS